MPGNIFCKLLFLFCKYVQFTLLALLTETYCTKILKQVLHCKGRRIASCMINNYYNS